MYVGSGSNVWYVTARSSPCIVSFCDEHLFPVWKQLCETVLLISQSSIMSM